MGASGSFALICSAAVWQHLNERGQACTFFQARLVKTRQFGPSVIVSMNGRSEHHACCQVRPMTTTRTVDLLASDLLSAIVTIHGQALATMS